ncbi:MAG TPA: hypothetical protein VHD56_07725 [Tepidisphaeraceae bacterium]|nr:hypothetical protein [Tepidisphaeraceae bacterium]
MPKLSWAVIAYGLVLIAVDSAFSAQANLPKVLSMPCWAVGLLLIAAGLAAAQRRHSLRQTGAIVGIILPLFLGCMFGWHVITGERQDRVAIMVLTALSLVSFAEVVMALSFRPREGIASRGYAVPIATPKPKPTETSQPRRSEVG